MLTEDLATASVPEEEPRFPDIIPDRIVKSHFRNIGPSDLTTSEEIDHLLQLLWERPEVRTYLFWRTGEPLNPLITSAEQVGRLKIVSTESQWFKHPNFKNDYIQISEKYGVGLGA